MRRRTVLGGMVALPLLTRSTPDDTARVDSVDDERRCYGAFQY
ncbi:hypothetical protein [Haloplanus litoreus]